MKIEIEVDDEIVDLVKALNTYGISTASSCSGHEREYGHILLGDGRILVIIPKERTKHEIAQILGKEGYNGILEIREGYQR